jgi:hypothetical protein
VPKEILAPQQGTYRRHRSSVSARTRNRPCRRRRHHHPAQTKARIAFELERWATGTRGPG